MQAAGPASRQADRLAGRPARERLAGPGLERRSDSAPNLRQRVGVVDLKVLDLDTAAMVHVATPLLAAEFALGEHPLYRWRHVPVWLAYFPLYLGFILVRAALAPRSGSGEGGSPYPYGFIDVDQIGWGGLALNIPLYLGAFALLAGLIVLADHAAGWLDQRPHVVIAAGSDPETATALHEQIPALCFIARSVRFPVHHEPVVKVAGADPS